MTEIIPAINVRGFKEVAQRIRVCEGHVRAVHIDVADGTFTPKAVWHNAEDLRGFKTPLIIEIHLMVENLEEKMHAWFIPEVRRIIFHHEVARDTKELIDFCHSARKEAGVAICPDTPWEVLMPSVGQADILQMLAVAPGPSGQPFDRRVLDKIRNLRAYAPASMLLEVDGGIKPGIAKECRDTGANFLVAGSTLFNRERSFKQSLRLLNDDLAA